MNLTFNFEFLNIRFRVRSNPAISVSHKKRCIAQRTVSSWNLIFFNFYFFFALSLSLSLILILLSLDNSISFFIIAVRINFKALTLPVSDSNYNLFRNLYRHLLTFLLLQRWYRLSYSFWSSLKTSFFFSNLIDSLTTADILWNRCIY